MTRMGRRVKMGGGMMGKIMMVGIGVLLFIALVATGGIGLILFLVVAFLIAAVIIWVIKLIAKDFGLVIFLILLGGVPSVFLADWVSRGEMAGLLAEYNLQLPVFIGFMVGIIILISILVGVQKRHVAKEFSRMYAETDRWEQKTRLRRSRIDKEFIDKGLEPPSIYGGRVLDGYHPADRPECEDGNGFMKGGYIKADDGKGYTEKW